MEEGRFRLAVTNAGEPIPAEIRSRRLFQPFFRAGGGRAKLSGLGLYIASEIARAHRGTLEVSSTPERTCFTFSMPLR